MQRQHCHILILLTIATLATYACAPGSQTEMDPDEQAIGALVACQGVVVKSVSDSAVATPFYESEMVTADAAGSRFQVRSYVEVGTDTLNLRRISYTCTATRLDKDERRINALSIDRGLSENDRGDIGASND